MLIVVMTFVNAGPVLEFQHEDIQAGETILATITTTGEFSKQITSDNLVFYKGRKETIFENDVIYHDGIHYVFIYANRDGEFELRVENILYKENETLKSINIIKPFNITTNLEFDEETNETMTKILSIRPGVVSYPKNSDIRLFNPGTTVLELSYKKEEMALDPLATISIDLFPEEKLSYFNIKGYKDFSIPIIYSSIEDVFVPIITSSEIKSDPDYLVSELFTNVRETEFIQIYNLELVNITNIEVSTDLEYIKLEGLEDMQAKGIQNLSLKIESEEAGHFSGEIKISYFSNNESGLLKIPVSLYVLEKGTNETDFEVLEDSCDNLNGQVCSKGSLCEEGASRRFTSDGKWCCFGECVIKEAKSSEGSDYGWAIALVILAALGGYGYYMYKKQKNVSPKKPREKIKESVNKYEKRIEVKPISTTRVKGNLQKS